MNTYTRNAARTIPGPRRIRPTQVAPAPTYVLSLAEAAKELRISERFLRGLATSGDLPSFTIGDRKLVRRSDLEAYVDRAVGRGYSLNLPRNLGEAKIAATQCEREVDQLREYSRTSRDAEQQQACASAARAFAILAQWFKWNAGEFEQEEGVA